MEPTGVLKLSLNQEEFYAGDQIVAHLQFTSRLPQRIRILALQLAGFCTVNRNLVDEAKLEALRKMPSYLFGSFGALGGGRIMHTAMPKYSTT